MTSYDTIMPLSPTRLVPLHSLISLSQESQVSTTVLEKSTTPGCVIFLQLFQHLFTSTTLSLPTRGQVQLFNIILFGFSSLLVSVLFQKSMSLLKILASPNCPISEHKHLQLTLFYLLQLSQEPSSFMLERLLQIKAKLFLLRSDV